MLVVRRFLLLLVSVFAVVPYASAFDQQRVPDILKPWIPWVLSDQVDLACPFGYQDFQQKLCVWPSRLQLDLTRTGGHFHGEWQLHRAGWITLPGDSEHWPQRVSLERTPAVVLQRDGRPVVWSAAARVSVSGEFVWNALPERLSLPEATALIGVAVDGRPLSYPHIEAETLWLAAGAVAEAATADSLDLQVFRRISDDNPLQVSTRLELNVSGKVRDVDLAYALLPGFVPVSIHSPLPARIEPNGHLRVQIRAGRWQLDLNARYPNQPSALTLPPAEASVWPSVELWSFQAEPKLRVVEIAGVTQVDPSQTNVPAEWQALPTYRVQAGQSMHFQPVSRGDPDSAPNQLSLTRNIWLDFAGTGYTVRDRISGTMNREWRLNAMPAMQLGQVLLDGKNQLITTLADGERGVEIRRGSLEMLADSRLEQGIGRIDATGWRHVFQQAEAELNIPPGWRLLAVSGVDNRPACWLFDWRLSDLFLIVLIVFAAAKLWTWRWGAVLAIALLLIWQEPDAPRWIWLHLFVALHLLRKFPQQRWVLWLKGYRNVCYLALLLLLLPFALGQLRLSLYPQGDSPARPPVPVAMAEQASIPAPMADAMEAGPPVSLFAQKAHLKRAMPAGPAISGDADTFERVDPDANLQTGPGIPQWHWHTVHLSWNGSVDGAHQLGLWYLPPLALQLLRIVQTGLTLMLAVKLFGWPRDWRKFLPNPACVGLALVLFLANADLYAQIPDANLLQELKTRLLEAPDCLPECAQISDLVVGLDSEQLRLELEVHAQTELAVPIPGDRQQWYPNDVLLNGMPASGLIRQQQQLWLKVPAGVNRVVMHGAYPLQDRFVLVLPLVPQKGRSIGDGWTVSGFQDNGRVGPQLEFNRNAPRDPGTKRDMETMRPFLRVERELHLDLDWRVTTRVLHQGEELRPVLIEVPLLAGESVLSANVRVQDGKAVVTMPAGQSGMEWQSSLDKRDTIELTAADAADWSEVWRADIAPLWHVQSAGIPVLSREQGADYLPEWRPWPGEKVILQISRPKPAPGVTLTIERSDLTLTQSDRDQSAVLDVHLRSSKGGLHSIKLPPGAQLQQVSIDGVVQAIRLSGDHIRFPLRPGQQQIGLEWRTVEAQSLLLRSPAVDLGMPSVNHHIRIVPADGRWLLFAAGPGLGPANAFWGIVALAALLAWGLGKASATPLKAGHWLILLLGLSQLPTKAALLPVVWLLAVGLRERCIPQVRWQYHVLQIGLLVLSLAGLLLLAASLRQALLGEATMFIAGNHSATGELNWYQDRVDSAPAGAFVLSVPMVCYRLVMLLWSFWLVVSLLNWLPWVWRCLTAGGLWKPKPPTSLSV
ncbi:hypothetical protein [Methylomonas rhizoryzae]|uniref:hypothetical protein n=1 Tax=Methylomonas rhizoryzae TaxID=2608981 RepID=UPI0012319DFC|nr:hypothetical protein [Methylomonas rhizoryzae]